MARTPLRPNQHGEPRVAGDLTYNGYWRVFSLVLDVQDGEITELNLTLPNEKLGAGTVNVKSHRTAWDWRRDVLIEHGLLDNMLCGINLSGGWSSADDLYATLVDIAENWLEIRYASQGWQGKPY